MAKSVFSMSYQSMILALKMLNNDWYKEYLNPLCLSDEEYNEGQQYQSLLLCLSTGK